MTASARRERRQAERAHRRDVRRTRQSPKPSVWRSPMVIFTIAALVVGAAIVAFALLQRPSQAPVSNELTSPAARIPADLSVGRSLGKADAPVTIDIWSDFQCPACRSLAVDVEPAIIATYVVPGDVKLVYHDAAFQGMRGDPNYDESVQAAAAARVAADQGRFWQMHDWLFANWNGENKGAFGAERLTAIADAAGLDRTAYEAGMAAGDKQAAAQAETQQGVAVGVNSTPTLFINGTRFTGTPTLAQLSAMIESARQ
jgi:protein-disulfide isomerase